ncbi:MAG: hypothetical protein ACXW2E_01520 [Nitrososphaeraceae archaeon]
MSSLQISYIITSSGVSIVNDSNHYTIDSSHPNYTSIIDALKNNRNREVLMLLDLKQCVSKFINNPTTTSIPSMSVSIDNKTISYNGELLNNSLVRYIFEMIGKGFTVDPLLKLLANLYNNPSKKAIDEFYTFIDYGKMPITDDGCFIAYKRVNADYTSIYDKKTDNSIGNVVSMPRHSVDDRSEQTCSTGLHICSFEYLKEYPGDKVIIVKVNPADVVSIPVDYKNTKARVCKYTVIGELTEKEANANTHSFNTPVYVTVKEQPPADAEVQTPSVLMEKTEQNTSSNESVSLNTPSNWYIHGYNVGYSDGRKKKPTAEDVTLSMYPSSNLSQQNVNDINDGYNLGYSHGKSHIKKAYSKIEKPQT